MKHNNKPIGRQVLGMIADHPTPKIFVGGDTAYTMSSRDYKGVMVIVLQGRDDSLQPDKPKRNIPAG